MLKDHFTNVIIKKKIKFVNSYRAVSMKNKMTEMQLHSLYTLTKELLVKKYKVVSKGH